VPSVRGIVDVIAKSGTRGEMSAHVTMAANGRLVIPAQLRGEVGLADGGTLVACVDKGVITPEPLAAVTRRVQAEVRLYVPEGADLAEELVRERRREAANG